MSYRIFIDETGDHSEAATNNPNRRFLSITGVILDEFYIDGVGRVWRPKVSETGRFRAPPKLYNL